MRVFLYAAKKSSSHIHFTNTLFGLIPSHEIIVLPEGCKFVSYLSFKMRSGDLLILFAENKAELDELMELADEYEPFRVILVMKEYSEEMERQVQSLCPCFTTSSQPPLDGLRDVIEKIASSTNK